MPHRDIEARRAYDRRYYANHQETLQARQREYTLKHPGRHAAATERWRRRWPERVRQLLDRQSVRRMVRRRVLKVLQAG